MVDGKGVDERRAQRTWAGNSLLGLVSLTRSLASYVPVRYDLHFSSIKFFRSLISRFLLAFIGGLTLFVVFRFSVICPSRSYFMISIVRASYSLHHPPQAPVSIPVSPLAPLFLAGVLLLLGSPRSVRPSSFSIPSGYRHGRLLA